MTTAIESHRSSWVPRDALRRCKDLIDGSPDLKPRYELAKQVIRNFRTPAFYEISQRCNIWCEGCYYFENRHRLRVIDEPSTGDWLSFFESEAARGVSMAYFVGAEPALERDRLLAASRYLTHGKIGTNGTIKLDPDIRFRIGVSVWGDDETDTLLRGGSILRKALRNYAGDERAVMLFTLSPWNLHTVPAVLAASRDHGLPVTFSVFSPTRTYADKIAAQFPSDDKFFRLAPDKGMPVFSTDDLLRLKEAMTRAMNEFPETVLCTPGFRDVITQTGPLFDIDPDSQVARNCGSRIVGNLRYHSTALTAEAVKCCTPDIECRDCRLYSGVWSSQFIPDARFLRSRETFVVWLDMMEMLGRIFLYPLPEIYRHVGQATV